MFPPKKILFPVDFSVRCTDAARMVETFAGHFQAELTLLHVVEPLTYNDVPVDVDAVRRKAAQRLPGRGVEAIRCQAHPAAWGPLFPDRGIRTVAGFRPDHVADPRLWDLSASHSGIGHQQRSARGVLSGLDRRPHGTGAEAGRHCHSQDPLRDRSRDAKLPDVALGQTIRGRVWSRAANCPRHSANKDNAFAENLEEQLLSQAEAKIRDVQECVGTDAKVIGSGRASSPVRVRFRRARTTPICWSSGGAFTDGFAGRLRANAYAMIRQSPCPVVSV